MLIFMSGPAVFKIPNSIYDIYIAKHKSQHTLFNMVANLKYKFWIFSLILKSFHDCFQYKLYMLQVSVIINLGYLLTISISLVIEYFIFHKVTILIKMYRPHTKLPHPFW